MSIFAMEAAFLFPEVFAEPIECISPEAPIEFEPFIGFAQCTRLEPT
ncbi:MAG: hypothetical protein WAV38_06315 [Xanthobacteraceae bacterium]